MMEIGLLLRFEQVRVSASCTRRLPSSRLKIACGGARTRKSAKITASKAVAVTSFATQACK